MLFEDEAVGIARMVVLIRLPLTVKDDHKVERKKDFALRIHFKYGSFQKEFEMGELTEVFMFCGFYSGVVIYALWITVLGRVETNS